MKVIVYNHTLAARRQKLLSVLLLLFMIASIGGCSYYNTYYNIKKRFKEAEKENVARAPVTSTVPGMPGATGLPFPTGRPGSSSSGGADKYRKVLETGSKLLEYYPKSRWIDDTLLLMGISYYRVQDWSRAERKFNEILTIYADSEHAGEARLWKARALKEQKRDAEAIRDLEEGLTAQDDKRERARSQALLAELLMTSQDWVNAAENYSTAIPNLRGSDLTTAHYNLGLCQYQRGEFASARSAFMDAAPAFVEKERAFEAYALATRCDIASGNYPVAKKTLLNLRRESRFQIYVPDIDIELARLSVSSGDLETGIKQLQAIIDREPNGPQRGKAFYHYGLVERDQRANLRSAKALLDSAIASGAQRDIQDSARAATEQISKGLVAIEAITELRDSIDVLQALIDSSSLEGESSLPDFGSEQNSTGVDPIAVDTTTAIESTIGDSVLKDSGVEVAEEFISPARAMADSLLRLMDAEDAERRANEVKPTADSVSTIADTIAIAAPAATYSRETLSAQLVKVRKRLQRSYLNAAEFYLFTLSERDSALTYYAQAASDPINPGVYWRSNLYLARSFSQDSLTAELSGDFYRAIVDADSVPLAAQNEARRVLGLELVNDPHDAQRALFASAESAQLSGETALESLPALYAQVVEMDTTTSRAYRALVAQFYIYDGRLGPYRVPDSARALGERIQSMFPDSSIVNEIKREFAPDDSSSIYLMSDAEMANLYFPKQNVKIEEEASETGWPPPEESLRGRRYN